MYLTLTMPSVQNNVVNVNVLVIYIYVTLLRKNGLIAGLAKIDFFLEKASTKFKYCLGKI